MTDRTVRGITVMTRRMLALAVSFAVMPVSATWAEDASHAPPHSTLSSGFAFSETSGDELFANACQACHMPDGKGAVGAGSYPSIANDHNLASSGYPVHIVVNGQRAMPPFGATMNDDQIAAVVNYVRTHFGNSYQDAVTAEDVRTARPKTRGKRDDP